MATESLRQKDSVDSKPRSSHPICAHLPYARHQVPRAPARMPGIPPRRTGSLQALFRIPKFSHVLVRHLDLALDDIVEFDSWDFTGLEQHDVLLAELQPIQKLVLRNVDYRANFLAAHVSAFTALTDLRILELHIWRDLRYGFDMFVKVILDLVRQLDKLPMQMWRSNMPLLRILDWGNCGKATLRRRSDGSMEVTNDGDDVFFSG